MRFGGRRPSPTGVVTGMTMVAANTEPRGVIGDGLRMIAGRHGDDATRAARRPFNVASLLSGAALLERVGDLQIFVFDENIRASECSDSFGAGNIGVRRTRPARIAWASWISCSVTIIRLLRSFVSGVNIGHLPGADHLHDDIDFRHVPIMKVIKGWSAGPAKIS